MCPPRPHLQATMMLLPDATVSCVLSAMALSVPHPAASMLPAFCPRRPLPVQTWQVLRCYGKAGMAARCRGLK